MEIFCKSSGSRFAKVVGISPFRVNSLHHQGVKRLAQGFKVSARASDGFVEVIEHESYPAVGIQFHPECATPYKGRKGYDRERNLKIYREIAELLGVGE